MELALSDLDAVYVGDQWLNVGANRDLKVVSVVDDDEGHEDVIGAGRALIWQTGNKWVAIPVDQIKATRWNA